MTEDWALAPPLCAWLEGADFVMMRIAVSSDPEDEGRKAIVKRGEAPLCEDMTCETCYEEAMKRMLEGDNNATS